MVLDGDEGSADYSRSTGSHAEEDPLNIECSA